MLSELNDSEMGRYQTDRQRNMQVSSWVMNSSGFKEHLTRPRVQRSPTSDLYHTAVQSLSSNVSHGVQDRRGPDQSSIPNVSHGVQRRRGPDQALTSQGEQRRHETTQVQSAQSGARVCKSEGGDRRRYSFPVLVNHAQNDRELGKKEQRPKDIASLQSLESQDRATKCVLGQNQRYLPDIPESAVRSGSAPEKYLPDIPESAVRGGIGSREKLRYVTGELYGRTSRTVARWVRLDKTNVKRDVYLMHWCYVCVRL